MQAVYVLELIHPEFGSQLAGLYWTLEDIRNTVPEKHYNGNKTWSMPDGSFYEARRLEIRGSRPE